MEDGKPDTAWADVRSAALFVSRTPEVAREATLAAGVAALVAATLAWAGPPGADLAAHVYQRWVYLHHGFMLWNNFWYAGRYSFVTYSVLYYPLAGLLGIRLLAVATIAAAALAFAVLLWREFGPAARWSSRTFAVVWAGIVLSAAFPFALGAALALFALCALQARRMWRFAALGVLTAAASPVAFLLLAVVTAGIGIGRRLELRLKLEVGLSLLAVAGLEVLLWRTFPGGGTYHFSAAELAAVCVFCVLATALTWRVERARVLRFLFVVYGAACLVTFLVPSAVGENIARLRYIAIPIAVLVLSLRSWRPRLVALLVLGLAISWNVSPLAANFLQARTDPAARQAYWKPAISYLHTHLAPSYRVEAVDTVGHWPALYLARAGIPLARGWFRQDDFPLNAVLYGRLGPDAYLSWMHRLGIQYVVSTRAPPDYSSRAEAALVAGPRSPVTLVYRTRNIAIYAVPNPVPIVTGEAPARVRSLTQSRIVLSLSKPGRYDVAIRYSPYWRPSVGCLSEREDGMIRYQAPHAGVVVLRFDVSATQALRAVAGHESRVCASGSKPTTPTRPRFGRS
jgi:hypothetical protein